MLLRFGQMYVPSGFLFLLGLRMRLIVWYARPWTLCLCVRALNWIFINHCAQTGLFVANSHIIFFVIVTRRTLFLPQQIFDCPLFVFVFADYLSKWSTITNLRTEYSGRNSKVHISICQQEKIPRVFLIRLNRDGWLNRLCTAVIDDRVVEFDCVCVIDMVDCLVVRSLPSFCPFNHFHVMKFDHCWHGNKSHGLNSPKYMATSANSPLRLISARLTDWRSWSKACATFICCIIITENNLPLYLIVHGLSFDIRWLFIIKFKTTVDYAHIIPIKLMLAIAVYFSSLLIHSIKPQI